VNFSHWIDHHRRSILFLLVLLAIAGTASVWRLPVALFPQVQFPRVRISLEAGSQPATDMMLQVTRPTELALRAIDGVQSVRSTTSRGSTDIDVNFAWGRNMVTALAESEAAINQILPDLPAGTQFRAKRMEPAKYGPVVAYSLTSRRLSPVALRNLAEHQLVPYLSSVDGVAKVQIQGGQQAEYRVTIDPAKLHALGLSADSVVSALQAANVLQPIGRLQDHYKLYLVLSDNRFADQAAIAQTVLRDDGRSRVLLSDVASVGLATVPQFESIGADGQPAVLLNIYQQPGASVVALSDALSARLASFQPNMPAGVALAQWYDQSVLVRASEHSVVEAIVIGIALAGLVLLVFLRNWKITLVAVVSVPAVLAATLLMLYALGMTLNMMTLGGMAAAVGLIIDDVIVMIEQIVRRVAQTQERGTATVLAAAREFMHPQIGSSASTIIIFIPLAFLTGVTGAFFKALSLTMAVALLVSFLVALFVVPLLADLMLRSAPTQPHRMGALTRWINRGYTRLMVRLLRRPVWLAAGLVPLFVAAGLAFMHVGSGFMPPMDEGGFVLDYQAPAGTSLDETVRLLHQIDGVLSANPNIQTWSRRTGAGLDGTITEANSGDFFVRLKPQPRPSTEQVMNNVRQAVHAQVPGIDIDLAQLIEDEIGDLTSVPQPIDIRLFGNDIQHLRAIADQVARAIQPVPGVIDTKNGVVIAGDAVDVRIDRSKAAAQGLTVAEVTRQMQAYVGGRVATTLRRDVNFIGVRVSAPANQRDQAEQLAQLQIQASDGHQTALGDIARVVTVSGEPQLTRYDLKSDVAVTARIQGRSLGSTVADVRKVLDQPGLIPNGIYYQLGGLYQTQQAAFRGLMAVFVSAVALVFLLLLFLYERFATALAILLQPLLAAGAVFIGLFLTGIELNITAMMGMTMVIGIVTEIAIFYCSELRLIDRGQSPAWRLIQAGRNRMRPIVMSALAFALALLPLALDLGQGSAMQQPLAVAIISGLIIQLPLVLLVLPVCHQIFRTAPTAVRRH